MYVGCITCLGS